MGMFRYHPKTQPDQGSKEIYPVPVELLHSRSSIAESYFALLKIQTRERYI